jgi:hypothetical protein
MTVTIGSTTFGNLTAQPFGYEGTDVKEGMSARQWQISGLLKPSEWLNLVNTYNTWRSTRIQDTPTDVSLVVGTTIAFSGTGPGGSSWTNIACWFSEAPAAEDAGAFLRVTVTLVDANQALEVKLKEKEATDTAEDLPDLGTITIGGTTLVLTKPMDSYGPGPTMELTASGTHLISGALVVYKIRDVEGTTDLTGWNNIRTWYEAQIVAKPLATSWFPVSIPSATAERKTINGVVSDVYTVSIQLGQVL